MSLGKSVSIYSRLFNTSCDVSCLPQVTSPPPPTPTSQTYSNIPKHTINTEARKQNNSLVNIYTSECREIVSCPGSLKKKKKERNGRRANTFQLLLASVASIRPRPYPDLREPAHSLELIIF